MRFSVKTKDWKAGRRMGQTQCSRDSRRDLYHSPGSAANKLPIRGRPDVLHRDREAPRPLSSLDMGRVE
jgi:hypothetical protein